MKYSTNKVVMYNEGSFQVCHNCKENKDHSEYATRKRRVEGVVYRAPEAMCKACRKLKSDESRRRRGLIK